MFAMVRTGSILIPNGSHLMKNLGQTCIRVQSPTDGHSFTFCWTLWIRILKGLQMIFCGEKHPLTSLTSRFSTLTNSKRIAVNETVWWRLVTELAEHHRIGSFCHTHITCARRFSLNKRRRPRRTLVRMEMEGGLANFETVYIRFFNFVRAKTIS